MLRKQEVCWSLPVLAQTQAWRLNPSSALFLRGPRSFLGDQEAHPGPPFPGMIFTYTEDNRRRLSGHRSAYKTAEGTQATLNWGLSLSSLSSPSTIPSQTDPSERQFWGFHVIFLLHNMSDSEKSHSGSSLSGPWADVFSSLRVQLTPPPITFETSERNKATFFLGEIASSKWWKQLAKNVLE